MKRRVIAAASAMAMLFAACGGGTQGTSGASGTPGGTASSTQTGTILERSKGVTFRKYDISTAASWNVQNDVVLEASNMYGYLVDGFYNVKGNADGTGYEFIPGMASEFPVDITSQYAGNPTYNVPADAKEGYAFSIKLNEKAKWEDGTPITADDYIYSYKELLNPLMKNKRADSVYYGKMIVANAEKYFKQGDSYENIVTVDENNKKVVDNVADSEMYFSIVYYGKMIVANAEKYFKQGDSYENIVTVDENNKKVVDNVADSEMYFSILQPVTFFGAAPSDYYNDPKHMDKFTVNGVNLYNKYKNQVYWKLTDEAKKDLSALAAAFGDNNPDAYKEMCFKKVVNDPVDFANVGIKKAGDYELHFILDKTISDFFLKYTLTSNYLVHKDTYESNKTDLGGLVQTKYMTSLETTKSYGPYKLTEFIDNKLVVFEQNPNWYGWTSGDYEWKGNYDKVRIDVIPEYETQFQTFLQGKLDSVVLNPEKSDYYGSDFLVQVPQPTTWAINFYSNKAGLKKQEKPGINKAMLSYHDFRQGISIGIDRHNIAKVLDPLAPATSVLIGPLYIADPVNKAMLSYHDFRQGISIGIDRHNIAKVLDPLAPATSVLIGPLYIADPVTFESYRSLDEAKQALVDVYGGTEADASYNPQKARELITKAYNEAVANGDYKDGDVIEVQYPRPADTDSGRKILKALEDGILEVLKGTPLEGKFKVTTLITDAWNDKMVSGEGQVTISGVTGGTMDPYGTLEFMIRPEKTYGFNFDKVDLELEVNGKKETNSIYKWVTEIDNGKYRDLPDDTKMYILSRLEAAVLNTFAFIPIQENAANSLYSKRTKLQYENYVPLVSRGEVYFSMTDAEWDSYVNSQNGKLDYK